MISIVCRGAALCLVLAGCYTQRPLETPVPAPETRIIARVTDSGAVVLGGPVGPGALQVEGVVATADPTMWQLNLTRVEYKGGSSVIWNRELVSVPRYAISNVTEKRVSKSRSWLAAGLITAGAVLASRLFSSLGAGQDPGDGGGNPQN